MLELTLSQSPETTSPSTSSTRTTLPTLIIKGRAYDVDQLEQGIRLKFQMLNTQVFGKDVVLTDSPSGSTTEGEQGAMDLDMLYETISVMAGAFVERTQEGKVSFLSRDTVVGIHRS
jgi:hypothetical protein